MSVLLSNKRRITRAPVNPMDKCTICSIYPKAIHEEKPTIQPGVFDISAGSYEKPAVLVVGTNSWWREIDESMPLLEIPVSSVNVADSVVVDYCNGVIVFDPNESMPGLFYVHGELNAEQIKANHKNELDIALRKQTQWYRNLIELADSLWVNSGGQSIVISGDMRLAAKELNLREKPWIKDSITMDLTNCPACGFMVNPAYPICGNCKQVINQSKFDELSKGGSAVDKVIKNVQRPNV